MEIVDLFCGGGGSSTGFHQAGFQTVFAVDSAWHARETFKLNHGNVVHNYDISKLRSEVILSEIGKKPTVVTASPPCEPFTVANSKRIKNPYNRLFDDNKGRLMLHAIRLIADLEPEFYFIENVRGILDGEGEELLTEEIESMGLGKPHFNWINAVNWGVPSERTRIIVSNLELKNPYHEMQTVRDAIGDLPPPDYPHGYEYHTTTPVSSKYQDGMITLPPGAGLVYFYGSSKDYQNYIRIPWDRPAPVVMGKSRFVHPDFDRLLTPLENARLMTFPDNYHYAGGIEQIYDVIGEAVPPRITYEIGKQVIDQL